MKKLIINALNEAKVKVEKAVPKVKRVTQSIDISDVEPINLQYCLKIRIKS